MSEASAAAARKPIYWADRMRNIATLMVIMIHVAAPVAYEQTDYTASPWWFGNFWNSCSRPGVPLFVMLSGFLLLSKDYPLLNFLSKRFTRVIIPALFWMVIYLFYGYAAKQNPADLKGAAIKILEGPVHYHLWFIYLIIGLYLVYPVLRPWVKQAKEADFLFFFALCALGAWVYKILAVFFNIHLGIYFELVTNNCGHFVAGYYLGHKGLTGLTEHQPDNPNIKPWSLTRRQMLYGAWGLILGGTVSTMLLTWLFNGYWSNGGKFVEYFYDYLTPNVFAGAAGWFLLIRWGMGKHPLIELEREFSAASFGIYFAHVLVMDWFAWNGYWHSRIHQSYGLILLFLMVSLMVLLLIKVIRAIPGGDKIT